MFRSLICAGALALSACGSGSSADTNVASACTAGTNMSESVCDCLGKKAKQKLSRKGQAFVVASLGKNHEKAQQITKSMKHDEVAEAGTFLVWASTECAME